MALTVTDIGVQPIQQFTSPIEFDSFLQIRTAGKPKRHQDSAVDDYD